MKANIMAKIFIALCLTLILLLTFSACKDKEIFAETSDFESYPDDWNNFNEDSGEDSDDIFVPQNSSDTPGETPDFSDDDVISDTTSSTVSDTDGDGKPNHRDDDIDNDGEKNENDDDIDGDGVENEKDPDKDGDGTTNEGDPTPEGPSGDDSNHTNEGPFVPLN